MKRPTPTGRAALRVIPMSPPEVADLISRARQAGLDVRAEAAGRGGTARSLTASAGYRMTPCRVAAHLARFSGCSMPQAAQMISKLTRRRVSPSGVHHAFRRIYPTAQLWTKRRGVTRAAFEAGAPCV